MSWPQCIMTSPALPLWQCHHSTPQTLPASRCTCGHMVSKKWSKIKFQAYSTDFTHKKEKTQQTPGEYNQERVGFFQLVFFLAYPLTKIPQNSKLAKKSRMSQQPPIKQPHLSVITWEPVLAANKLMLTLFPRHLVVRSLHFLSGLMHLSHAVGLPTESALVTDEGRTTTGKGKRDHQPGAVLESTPCHSTDW